jgi:hypothetical protein
VYDVMINWQPSRVALKRKCRPHKPVASIEPAGICTSGLEQQPLLRHTVTVHAVCDGASFCSTEEYIARCMVLQQLPAHAVDVFEWNVMRSLPESACCSLPVCVYWGSARHHAQQAAVICRQSSLCKALVVWHHCKGRPT